MSSIDNAMSNLKKIFVVMCYNYETETSINQRAFLSEDAAFKFMREQLELYGTRKYDFQVDEIVIEDWPDKKVKNIKARNHLQDTIKVEMVWNEDYESSTEAKKEFREVCKDILKEYVGGEDNGGN